MASALMCICPIPHKTKPARKTILRAGFLFQLMRAMISLHVFRGEIVALHLRQRIVADRRFRALAQLIGVLLGGRLRRDEVLLDAAQRGAERGVAAVCRDGPRRCPPGSGGRR
jgi:hypothetical protein